MQLKCWWLSYSHVIGHSARVYSVDGFHNNFEDVFSDAVIYES